MGSAEARAQALFARTPKIRLELLEKIERGQLDDLKTFGLEANELREFVEGRSTRPIQSTTSQSRQRGLEAIVRKFGRPVLLIQNGTYEEPSSLTIKNQLDPFRSKINEAIKRVGRVEFVNHAMSWGGTGWVVADNLVITNRHVAEIVAESNGKNGFRFKMSAGGVRYGAKIDFLEEYNTDARGPNEFELKEVKFIARSDQPDMAMLEIEVDGAIPAPIDLLDAEGRSEQQVGIIGYPAYDSRNNPEDIARYFGNIFDVKRFAPGIITQEAGNQHFFMHDVTTLGGNSGSLVLDLESGRPIGLHYAGIYLKGNYAITAGTIKRALAGLKTIISVPKHLASIIEKSDGTHDPIHFKGREGYQEKFLGTEKCEVPLPSLGKWEHDAAEVTEAGGETSKALNYMHFSVVYSTSRRMPLFTAVNINGETEKKIKRSNDQWFFDLRIPRAIQLTQQDYSDQEIDRGHMVRREDPNWGSLAEAQIANDDTFHYTNAAPQHAKLNQGHTQWLGLEDYILSNAKTYGLNISVFTGPVLRDSDPKLENGLVVPEEFWKVVAAVDAETGNLRTTGYVLSQGAFIEDITEAFVYGQYRTYQVSVKSIEEKTGLSLGVLVDADAFRRHRIEESRAGIATVIPIDQLEDMVL
ncbi:MAG: DNA/RNA non-specific endonuclease [Nitrospira sp.]|nr:DNA/RNA non-specific endonuclease [Nitrospira sp.]